MQGNAICSIMGILLHKSVRSGVITGVAIRHIVVFLTGAIFSRFKLSYEVQSIEVDFRPLDRGRNLPAVDCGSQAGQETACCRGQGDEEGCWRLIRSMEKDVLLFLTVWNRVWLVGS